MNIPHVTLNEITLKSIHITFVNVYGINDSGVPDLDPIRRPAGKFAKSLGPARLPDLRLVRFFAEPRLSIFTQQPRKEEKVFKIFFPEIRKRMKKNWTAILVYPS